MSKRWNGWLSKRWHAWSFNTNVIYCNIIYHTLMHNVTVVNWNLAHRFYFILLARFGYLTKCDARALKCDQPPTRILSKQQLITDTDKDHDLVLVQAWECWQMDRQTDIHAIATRADPYRWGSHWYKNHFWSVGHKSLLHPIRDHIMTFAPYNDILVPRQTDKYQFNSLNK